MINHDKHDKFPNTTRIKASVVAGIATMGLAASSARAQSTQSETPPPPITQTGGAQAPSPEVIATGGVQSMSPEDALSKLTPAEQMLNNQAQDDANKLARLALKLGPKAHKSMAYTPGDNKMAIETITVGAPVKHSKKQGQYRFIIMSPVADDGRSLQLDNIDTVIFNQGIPNNNGELIGPGAAEASLGKNPATGAFQASGRFKTIGGGEQSVVANVIPLTPDAQVLTDNEEAATYLLIEGGTKYAKHGHPIDYVTPTFDAKGHAASDFAS